MHMHMHMHMQSVHTLMHSKRALHRRKARAEYLTRPHSSAPPVRVGARVTELSRETCAWRSIR